MRKKQIYAIAIALGVVGVGLTTGLVSKAAVVENGILKLEKDEAWTDNVPSTGKDAPVYVSEDEIIYTDSQGNKVYEYLNPVDPGNEPATMPDEVPSTEGNIQGDIMTLNEPIIGNASTSTNASISATTAEATNTNTSTLVPPSEPTNVQSSVTNSNLLDTNEQLPTGKSKVIENENGLLIQVFE